jgi:hypothetical protein
VVTGAPLAGVSGRPGARSDGTPPLSAASGPAGIATTEGRGAARPGHRGEGPPKRSTTSHPMTATSTTTLAAARGTWVYREISQRIGRLEMMFKIVLGEVKAIVGGTRRLETA